MSPNDRIGDTRCDVPMIHEHVVRDVQKVMTDAELLFDLADFFKVFGDSTRIRVLDALNHAELCVCDICALLLMSQSAVSHQLRVLKDARLVRNRRDGKVVYYSLDDEHVKEILDIGQEHLNEK